MKARKQPEGRASKMRGKARSLPARPLARSVERCWCAIIAPARREAHAAETAYLSVGGNIPHAGFFTTWMWADDQMAYCAQPSQGEPLPRGGYEKEPLSTASGRDAEAAADLWFGWGGPGFDYSMWPGACGTTASPMNDARYAALTHYHPVRHVQLERRPGHAWCTQAFRSWCQQNVLSFDDGGSVINSGLRGASCTPAHGRGQAVLQGVPALHGKLLADDRLVQLHSYGSVEA